VEQGVPVVTRPDLRWKRVDIKTVGLLPNLLAKQSAFEAGAQEAWLVNEKGFVTEGSATNAFIVAKDGALLTHPTDGSVLGGVTRANVLALARSIGIEVGERPFTLAEALAAREAFLTGTTVTVLGVASIDGHAVGDGRPGEVTRDLRARYAELRRS
jgi:D-alanine transaminase